MIKSNIFKWPSYSFQDQKVTEPWKRLTFTRSSFRSCRLPAPIDQYLLEQLRSCQ
jgi:hypothetical protein